MKIGILTLPLHTNYGGILQAWALQTVLERMGHEVEIFQKKRIRKISKKRMIFIYAKRIIKKYVFKQANVLVFEESWWNKVGTKAIRRHTDIFLSKYLHLRQIKSLDEIQENEYDAFVVGSDQVWRYRYFTAMMGSPISYAYLKFAEQWNVKRIAYAPSLGTDKWEYTLKQTQECARLAKLFDIVTVREKSAVNLCKEKFGIEAIHVLDPTMLLDTDDYIKLFDDYKTQKSEGNMHCYMLDQTSEKQALIERIADDRKLKTFSVLKPKNEFYRHPELAQPPVEQWLRAFYDSEFIVTDSFHACVFSILFRKQFVVYGNKSRGLARINSLLSALRLENRLVGSFEQYKKIAEIDYDLVFEQLDVWRIKSFDVLQKIS